MNIVVAYQWGQDPQEATVSADGAVDFSRAKPVVNEYDAVAIEVGRRLADASGATLIGVSVGGAASATPMATKAALSRGLDETFVVSDTMYESLGTLETAEALAAAVRHLPDVGLVITGDSSVDSGTKLVSSVLAGLLGWPTVTDAMSLDLASNTIRIRRSVAQGMQTLSLPCPAVVAVASDAEKPRVPGMKDVMAAGKKRVTIVSAGELGLAPAPLPRKRSVAKGAGPVRKNVRIDTTDPTAAADELVRALHTMGIVG